MATRCGAWIHGSNPPSSFVCNAAAASHTAASHNFVDAAPDPSFDPPPVLALIPPLLGGMLPDPPPAA